MVNDATYFSIKAVPLILLTCLLALGRRVNHPEKVSLQTETAEDGKKDIVPGAEKTSLHIDNLDLQAGGLEDVAGAQGAAAETLMPWRTVTSEVQRGHSPFKEVEAHKMPQATGDAMAAFLRALRIVCSAIYADARAAARAGLYKGMDLGSGNARESKKEADAAATTLIDAETMLFEKTQLLAGEALGKETLFAYMLEASDRGKEKTVKRVLERFKVQVVLLEIEIVKMGFNPKDLVALEKLQSGLSALEGQVEAMLGQERDGEEIDLTKPLLWEASEIYWGAVKVLPGFLKVKLNLLRNIVEKSKNDQAEDVKGIKIPPKMKKRIALDKFMTAVNNMEQAMEMETIIKKAIQEFVKAEVPTPAAFWVAKDKLGQAVKATMEKLEKNDPEMKERQKAKINEAVKEKKRAMEIVPY